MAAQILSFPSPVERQQQGLVAKMRRLAEQGHPRRAELIGVAVEFDMAHELFWGKPSLIDTRSFVAIWSKARMLYQDCTGEFV